MSAEQRWCILRCAGRATLPLAASLAEDGYLVWTPVETRIERVSGMSARREVRQAIMPSYIFARVSHLVDLLQLAAMSVKPRRGAGLRSAAHRDFSVLHAFGRIPLVAELHLAELRKLEARRTPRKIAEYAYPRDQRVRVKSGISQGKAGLVIRSTPAKTTILCSGDHFAFEIPTSLLELDDLEQPRLVARLAA